ncbi:MAG: hypothetical protein QNJ65_24260 [Xenococcaceae cyanobacterium MO_234.B1]|nr:hypothetical protein [Xenococcaceae cyanobacterium MO_234.B1]
MSSAMSPKLSQVKWNPYSPEFRTNPYPTYHLLREREPVHWSRVGGLWFLTRYADVKRVLRDRRVKVTNKSDQLHSKEPYLEPGQTVGDLVQMSSQFLIYMDPHAHTRLKNLLGKGFHPQVVEGLRPRIQKIVNYFLQQVVHLKPFCGWRI